MFNGSDLAASRVEALVSWLRPQLEPDEELLALSRVVLASSPTVDGLVVSSRRVFGVSEGGIGPVMRAADIAGIAIVGKPPAFSVWRRWTGEPVAWSLVLGTGSGVTTYFGDVPKIDGDGVFEVLAAHVGLPVRELSGPERHWWPDREETLVHLAGTVDPDAARPAMGLPPAPVVTPRPQQPERGPRDGIADAISNIRRHARHTENAVAILVVFTVLATIGGVISGIALIARTDHGGCSYTDLDGVCQIYDQAHPTAGLGAALIVGSLFNAIAVYLVVSLALTYVHSKRYTVALAERDSSE